MGKSTFAMFSLLIIVGLLQGELVSAAGTPDGSEQWGYVEVRPQAHLFWWLYRSPYRVEDPSKPWPTILWLQGGPGGSGVGFGNFLEIGPLDEKLNARNSTWLHKADLLFVDSPVGTGYSYVDDVKNKSLLVKTDEDAATDLTILLKELFNENDRLQQSPLYIVAESYGGKFAVTLGLSAIRSIEAGELNITLGGVALGDSWISPEDFVLSWGPLLKAVSRIDNSGLRESNRIAQMIKAQLAEGKYAEAQESWSILSSVVSPNSNSVDLYNFMLDSDKDPLEGDKASTNPLAQNYSITSLSKADNLTKLMNGAIREKLMIIPTNVSWGGQSDLVFSSMAADFMKPRIQEVDELLSKGINVTIYNGQLDVICSTPGTEAWVEKLKWEGLSTFLSLDRTPLYCDGDDSVTKAFMKSYKNLYFYWILGSGHFVPVEQPCISLEMIGNITKSPNSI